MKNGGWNENNKLFSWIPLVQPCRWKDFLCILVLHFPLCVSRLKRVDRKKNNNAVFSGWRLLKSHSVTGNWNIQFPTLGWVDLSKEMKCEMNLTHLDTCFHFNLAWKRFTNNKILTHAIFNVGFFSNIIGRLEPPGLHDKKVTDPRVFSRFKILNPSKSPYRKKKNSTHSDWL